MATQHVPRSLIQIALAVSLAACAGKKAVAPIIGTATIDRRTIVVDATATGAIEPITIVEVKSKAGGMIITLPVETGTIVRKGDLLVQIDTRDVQNQYEQSQADVNTAKASLEVAQAQKKRSDELFKARVITTQEYEAAGLSLTTAQAQIVRANTNLDLAKQRLDDATVIAPSNGTIIDRPVAVGMVIQSATGGSASGGTTLLKMADLSRVQVRVLVNETDIGSIRPDQSARVVVDAYPERPFVGKVEKIEPQAVVQQSVTMFPVIVSLDNSDGYLKPGMNGEVSVLIDQKTQVIAVPNDAVRSVREAATAAALVGLNPDTVRAQVALQQQSMGRGGNGVGNGSPTDAPATQQVAAAGGDHQAAGGADRQPAANGEARRGGNGDTTRARGNRGGGMGGMGGDTTRRGRGMRGQGDSAGGNRMRGQGGENGGMGQGAGNRGQAGGANRMGGRAGMSGQATPATRARSGLVFVQTATSFEPRIVRLGASNYDYSEVLSGLKEGEKVATLNVALLQARRDAQNDRQRAQQGGVPGMQRTPTGGTAVPGGPGGGGPGGGGPGGGGGGGQRGGGGRGQ